MVQVSSCVKPRHFHKFHIFWCKCQLLDMEDSDKVWFSLPVYRNCRKFIFETGNGVLIIISCDFDLWILRYQPCASVCVYFYVCVWVRVYWCVCACVNMCVLMIKKEKDRQRDVIILIVYWNCDANHMTYYMYNQD